MNYPLLISNPNLNPFSFEPADNFPDIIDSHTQYHP